MTKLNEPKDLKDLKSPNLAANNMGGKQKGDARVEAEERNSRSPQSKEAAHDFQQEPRKVSGDR